MLLPFALLLCCIRTSKTCKTNFDCSLNGDCVDGACKCEPAWQGSEHCDVFRVLPMSKTGGYHNKSFASWGGNAIFENGKYHLFVAQIVNHCGLAQWGRNSAIVRAEAIDPGGPYTFIETVLLPFAHNPTVRRLPEGGLVLFFIGSGNSSVPISCDPVTGKPQHLFQEEDDLIGSGVHAMRADTVYGPWSTPVQLQFVNDSNWRISAATNPSPHVDEDGTVTLALQARLANDPKHSLLGVARAKDWRGPYIMMTPSPIVPEKVGCIAGMGEDPFLWKDSRGWHIVYHGMCPSGVMQAHLAYSQDCVHWTQSTRQTYSYVVTYVDGSNQRFARVERPQLLFSATGSPTHIVNGVCDGSSLGKQWECLMKQDGMTWTIARPLGRSSETSLIVV